MISATVRSTIRSLGVITATSLIAAYIPAWSKNTFSRTPLLVFNVCFMTVIFLYTIWRRYSSDVKVVFLHLSCWTITLVIQFKEEYLSLPDGNTDADMRRRKNQKLVRAAVIFLMVQSCIMPAIHFAWLHSLLAYKFLWDVYTFVRGEFQSRQLGHQDVIQERAPSRELSGPVKFLIQFGKGAFGLWVLLYQTFYVNFWYVITTVAYFSLAQNCFERPFTRALENAQLDTFEGLEQYYVVGFLGFLEILFALFFMLWSLVQHEQFLMLIALYTNVYAGGREIISNAVSAAFAEWALVAHFERASPEELRELDDICSICLCKMYKARKTSCRHFFHGHCLRRCLKERASCPICNKRFDF